jgi:hypothetical protein
MRWTRKRCDACGRKRDTFAFGGMDLCAGCKGMQSAAGMERDGSDRNKRPKVEPMRGVMGGTPWNVKK